MLLRALYFLFTLYIMLRATIYSLMAYMIHILMVLKSISSPRLSAVFLTPQFKCPLISSNSLFHRYRKLTPKVPTHTAPPSQLLTATMPHLPDLKPETWASSLTSVLKFHQPPKLLTASQTPFWICWLVSLPFYNALVYHSLPKLCNHFLSIPLVQSLLPPSDCLHPLATAIFWNLIMSFHCLKPFSASPFDCLEWLSVVTRLIWFGPFSSCFSFPFFLYILVQLYELHLVPGIQEA